MQVEEMGRMKKEELVACLLDNILSLLGQSIPRQAYRAQNRTATDSCQQGRRQLFMFPPKPCLSQRAQEDSCEVDQVGSSAIENPDLG